jgi:hypothetical protein
MPNANSGMNYAEIAERLDTTPEAVRKLVARALHKIMQNGDALTFVEIVRAVHMRSSGPHIKCSSIECRPETWPLLGAWIPRPVQGGLCRDKK